MPPPRRRADAEQNRDRILSAARDALAGGGELRLNAVARRAGVGQGTLYRHFPTRADLLAEVYRQEVGELVAAAPRLLAEHDPVDALARWLHRVVAYARVKREVIAAVEASAWPGLSADGAGSIDGALSALLAAGRRTGALRPDVDAADVILLLGALTRVPEPGWDARAGRLVEIILTGLRAARPAGS